MMKRKSEREEIKLFVQELLEFIYIHKTQNIYYLMICCLNTYK